MALTGPPLSSRRAQYAAKRRAGLAQSRWLSGFAVRIVGQTQKLQLPVQCRPFHADEGRGARNMARETIDLDPQIFALEILSRFLERECGDRFGVRQYVGAAAH